MKKLFNVTESANNIDIALLIGRVSIALLMLVHGIPKITYLLQDEVQFMDFMGLGPEISLALTIFAEVVCSIFILFGLATRFALIPLIITMLVAVFIVHGADPFAAQEMGLHYLLGYVLLFITGSGKYSVDQLIVSRQSQRMVKLT